jgi:nucleoside-diphosphate-sugar epimerase
MKSISISILGCGWLGKPLAIELIKAGYEVRGSTTQESKLQELQSNGIIPFLIKFNPHPEGEKLEEFFRSDIIIVSIPPKRKSGQANRYVEIIKAVGEAARNGKVSKAIFISSTSVYPEKNDIVQEDDADESNYLVAAENEIRKAITRTTVLRFGGLIGPGRHPGNFLAGKKDLSGANAPVNIIHLDDCIAIISEVIRQDVWPDVFNACGDNHSSRKNFYTTAAVELELDPPQFLEGENTPFKIVSNAKLKSRLNYNFKH